jgi:Restriction Endonuclease associating with ARP
MIRLTNNPTSYVWLDAAQLIKHAFGLARTFHGRRIILLYLFWEPSNASNFSVFNEHRREIDELSDRVLGGFPEFETMSYRELWSDWERGDPPDWLRAHLQKIRARYEVAI